jgi:hypothetical protein
MIGRSAQRHAPGENLGIGPHLGGDRLHPDGDIEIEA